MQGCSIVFIISVLHLWTFKFAQKEVKVGSFHTHVKFDYRHSIKCLDYLFLYINNLVFLRYLSHSLLFCRYLMNHCGLYSTTHNRSYSVKVRELTAIHLCFSFYLVVFSPYTSHILHQKVVDVIGKCGKIVVKKCKRNISKQILYLKNTFQKIR